jgi:hypothetical protein
MIYDNEKPSRALKQIRLDANLVIVGGGLAGVCAAITAARGGIKAILVQDRPVLGGNASSEVRLWILGATSHMGNNNRWAREGGVIDEILVENLFRNPEGNPLFLDALLLEKAMAEPNITLLLNTAVFELTKRDPDAIEAVRAFCPQSSTLYDLHAPLFCDASGDGIAGFMAGAAFRMGAESRSEFGEKFAPTHGNGELLGHSLYFYSKDAGRPVKYTPPGFALTDITKIPRWRQFSANEHGCKLWWIEYGGRLDTVHDTEAIKWELWRVVYGVWHHIKNSGQFPEAENLTLEWVGHIPGKRESRRFEGDYILRQQDVVEQRAYADVVAHGGWAIDLHPADGVFSEKPGCAQWHAKGVYGIPYRCLYSRNISNLFLAGRIISASHVAFGSSRVMATCAAMGQAVGAAAVLCHEHGELPRALTGPARMGELQRALLRSGQHLPGVRLQDPADLAPRAEITASSELQLSELRPDGPLLALEHGWAMLLPVSAGTQIRLTVYADVSADAPLWEGLYAPPASGDSESERNALPTKTAELRVELRQSSRVDNHTPDAVLEARTIALRPARANASPEDLAETSSPARLPAETRAARSEALATMGEGRDDPEAERRTAPPPGLRQDRADPGQRRTVARRTAEADERAAEAFSAVVENEDGTGRADQEIEIAFEHVFADTRYAFVCFFGDRNIRLRTSEQRVTGVLSLCHKANLAVAKSAVQTPPDDIGVDTFEFWQPQRRPAGRNFALCLDSPLAVFAPCNVVNGIARPTHQPNAWVADFTDAQPTLTLSWTEQQTIARIELTFDSDYDHPMESVLMGHPERRMPFCVERYRVLDEHGVVLAERHDNHQTRNIIVLARPVMTRVLRIELTAPSASVPAALFEVRCYATPDI